MKTKILFRPSELGDLMTNPRSGKSNLQKLEEAIEKRTDLETKYQETKNKETKAANTLVERIAKLTNEIQELEKVKHVPHLSDTCKKALRKKMIEIKYKRYQDVESKQMTKGKEVEEESIDNYSLIKGKIFKNNKVRIQNEYYSGEIDLPWENERGDVYEITDIKSSYNIHSFFDNHDGIKPKNKWQGVGYLDLYPTAKRYNIANMLTDNTDDAVLLDLHRESYKWQDGDTPTWREVEIIKNHIYTEQRFKEITSLRGCVPTDEKTKQRLESFVEVPLEDRMIEWTFERNEDDIQAARKRMDECRTYMEYKYGITHSDETEQ